MHLPSLITDLALILITAGVVALVFRWLKQPIVLGYLLAGILVGPQVSFLPNIEDPKNIKTWAELGIIFLLFVLGLEFSFKKLFQIGRPALVAATTEVVLMTLVGFGVGRALGWKSMDSIFLGGILAISSTTIIIKAFQARGIKTQLFASLVYGILIIEDLYAVILLALLSTVGATKTLEGTELLRQMGFLALFLVVIVPVGLWLVPRFLKVIRFRLDDEIRVIFSLGLCLGLVVLSTAVGFSPALGAFLMGAFLGETFEGERLERFMRPIRDLFGAIFFVSVGMLVDIHVALENWWLVILLSFVTIVGKVFLTAVGALAGGQDRRTAFQAGLSLGQIGEFSFIIATLGMTLGVIDPKLYPIAVSVALLTTFTTPYFIQWAAALHISAKGRSRRRRNDVPRLWDGHLVELEIHPHLKCVGKPLQDLKIREKFGTSIVAIHRGDRKLIAPDREALLLPFDRIIVLGTEKQLADLEKYFQSERYAVDEVDEGEFGLRTILLPESHELVGKSIRESKVPARVHGIILGIERGSKKILNPDSTTVLEAEDVLWLYGNRDEIKELLK